MSDDLLTHCKAALSNVIASDIVQQSDNPFKEFTDGIQNFVQHYCRDSLAYSWCHHPKVTHNQTFECRCTISIKNNCSSFIDT